MHARLLKNVIASDRIYYSLSAERIMKVRKKNTYKEFIMKRAYDRVCFQIEVVLIAS